VGTASRLAVELDYQWVLTELAPGAGPAEEAAPIGDLATLLGGRRLLHYCEGTQAPYIVATGLLPNSWCTTTPLSSYAADIWLGTPRRKNYYVAFDPEHIPECRGPGLSPPDAGDPLRHGSAIEFFLPQGAPPKAVVDHGPLEEL
jgi:hypothetical protein